MSERLDQYLQLRHQLVRLRWVRAGFESLEEDALLEEMDEAWAALGPDDLTALKRQPPPPQLTRPVPRQVPGQRVRVDTDVLADASLSPRRLAEVA